MQKYCQVISRACTHQRISGTFRTQVISVIIFSLLRPRPGEIRFFNLPHIEHLIGARAELRGVSDLVAVLQGVDLSKVVGHTSVMARKPNIAVPAGGGFEMPGAFGNGSPGFRPHTP